jgi:hypothetical protein
MGGSCAGTRRSAGRWRAGGRSIRGGRKEGRLLFVNKKKQKNFIHLRPL